MPEMKTTQALRLFFLFGIGLLFCLSAGSPPAAGDTPVVTALDIEGNRAVSDAEILLIVQTRPGEPFSEAVLSDDIKRLMGTGFFERVTDRATRRPDGVSVLLRVEERPVIAAVTFKGNRKIPDRVLLEESRLGELTFYDREKAADAVGFITRHYYRKGFIFAGVDLETPVPEDGAVELVFNVSEGVGGRVASIFFEGNRHFSDRELRGEIRHRERALFLFRRGTLNREQLEQDRLGILRLYRRAGFSDAAVEVREVVSDRRLTLGFFVEEGVRFLLGDIVLSGDPGLTVDEVRGALALEPGQPHADELIQEAVGRLVAAYRRAGHLFPSVDAAGVLNPETGRVDLFLELEPGPEMVVERIDITGNTITRDRVIRREITQLPGERFDGDKVFRSQDNLMALGYFDGLSVEPREGTAEDRVRLVFDVSEREQTGRFLFGGGYNTLDGLIGMVSVEQNNFDWRRPSTFFRGGGQNLNVNMMFGGRYRDLRLGFTEPWLGDRPVSFGFDLFDWRREYRFEFDERRAGGRLRFGWRPPGAWRYSVAPGFERVEISDIRNIAYLPEEGVDNVHSVSFGATRDTRDSRVRARSGTEQGLTLKFAGGLLAGDRDFWRAEYDLAFFHPLPADFVFSSRTRVGYSRAFGSSERVPLSERFFAGGERSVRGYEARSLGPRDFSDPAYPDGVPIGGRLRVLETLEVARPLHFAAAVKPELAFFVDAGQAWPETSDFDFSDIKVGVGAGVRLVVPGMNIPVQLDYAVALDPLPGESRGRFHLMLGGFGF